MQCEARLGWAWLGLAGLGWAWLGLAGLGRAWPGLATHVVDGMCMMRYA